MKNEDFSPGRSRNMKAFQQGIIASKVSKRLGKELFYIDKLFIPIPGITIFYGDSGCGKTTLLNILGLMDDYDRRAPNAFIDLKLNRQDPIRYAEQYKKGRTAEVRRRFYGFMFQDDQLLDGLSIYENIILPLSVKQGWTAAKQADRRIAAYIRALALEGEEEKARAARKENPEARAAAQKKVLSRSPMTLSRGKRQRYALIRALLPSPRVVFADEPLASVDLATGLRIVNLLLANAFDRGVVLVIHDKDFQMIFRENNVPREGELPGLHEQLMKKAELLRKKNLFREVDVKRLLEESRSKRVIAVKRTATRSRPSS